MLRLDLSGHGPFGTEAHRFYERGLFAIPTGGLDGKVPLISWSRLKRQPGQRTLDDLVKKFGQCNIGVLCQQSNLTVVDVDDSSLTSEMIRRCGQTPLMTRTPSGGEHLWYRHNGERSVNLRHREQQSVDVKGVGGFVVAPPSIRFGDGPHAGKKYEFLNGSWDDLVRLPRITPGALPLVSEGLGPRARGPGRTVEGVRNETLFKALLRQAPACNTLDDLVNFAADLNILNDPALSESEVAKTAASAWKYELNGTNWVSRGLRVSIPRSHLKVLLGNTDALALLAVLIGSHGACAHPFAVSPGGMARGEIIPGWGKHRYRNARDWLIKHRFLEVVYEGGNGIGDVGQYALAKP